MGYFALCRHGVDERITHRHIRPRPCVKRPRWLRSNHCRPSPGTTSPCADRGVGRPQTNSPGECSGETGRSCRGDPCHWQPDPPRLLSPADTEAEQTCSAEQPGVAGPHPHRRGPVDRAGEELGIDTHAGAGPATLHGRYKNLIGRGLVPVGFVPTAPIPQPSHPLRSMPSPRNASRARR